MRVPRSRISVRALMLLLMASGCLMGWVVRRAHVQRDAVAAIRAAGGSVSYDWQQRNGRIIPNGQPRGPRWLLDWIGVDYFNTVVAVDLIGSGTEAGLAHVKRFGRLERLTLNSMSVTDDDLADLEGFTPRSLSLSLTGRQKGGDRTPVGFCPRVAVASSSRRRKWAGPPPGGPEGPSQVARATSGP